MSDKPKWDWRPGVGHGQQPLVEWWFEQIAGGILMRIAIRAFRRGDRQTFDRIWALVNAAADEEQLAHMRNPMDDAPATK